MTHVMTDMGILQVCKMNAKGGNQDRPWAPTSNQPPSHAFSFVPNMISALGPEKFDGPAWSLAVSGKSQMVVREDRKTASNGTKLAARRKASPLVGHRYNVDCSQVNFLIRT